MSSRQHPPDIAYHVGMARRIRRTILLLSLALCVLCIGFWVRSQFRQDAVVTRWPANGLAIRSSDGIVRLYIRTDNTGPAVTANAWHVDAAGGPFMFTDDPFTTGSWSFSTLIFQPTPTFEWERVQGPSNHIGMTITTTGGSVVVSGSPAAQPAVGEAYLRITFPYWLPICLFGVLPAFAGLRFATTHWRRYRRLLAGTCPICAYDLRATPGKCPECGWALQAPHDLSATSTSAPATTHAAS